MLRKVLATSALAATLALVLTGCTPPMPPEVKAAQAELTYTCESGSGSIALPAALQSVSTGWTDSLASACPKMSLAIHEVGTSSDLEVSEVNAVSADCKPFATVPFALDASVLVINEPAISGLVLDADLADQILSGEITNWNDPKLQKTNPGFTLPDEAIVVNEVVQQNVYDAFKGWLSRLLGHDPRLSLLKPIAGEETVDQMNATANAGIALVPYSLSVQGGFSTVSIQPDAADAATIVAPDPTGIQSAGTQYSADIAGDTVNLTFHADNKPIPPEGSDTPSNPYQAIYPVNLVLCGDSKNLVTRALAKFLLRQDSQGQLAASFMVQLPELVRDYSLEVVSKGLPEVVVPAA